MSLAIDAGNALFRVVRACEAWQNAAKVTVPQIPTGIVFECKDGMWVGDHPTRGRIEVPDSTSKPFRVISWGAATEDVFIECMWILQLFMHQQLNEDWKTHHWLQRACSSVLRCRDSRDELLDVVKSIRNAEFTYEQLIASLEEEHGIRQSESTSFPAHAEQLRPHLELLAGSLRTIVSDIRSIRQEREKGAWISGDMQLRTRIRDAARLTERLFLCTVYPDVSTEFDSVTFPISFPHSKLTNTDQSTLSSVLGSLYDILLLEPSDDIVRRDYRKASAAEDVCDLVDRLSNCSERLARTLGNSESTQSWLENKLIPQLSHRHRQNSQQPIEPNSSRYTASLPENNEDEEPDEHFQTHDGKWLTAELCNANYEICASDLSKFATKGCKFLDGKKLRRRKVPKRSRAYAYHRIDLANIEARRAEKDD